MQSQFSKDVLNEMSSFGLARSFKTFSKQSWDAHMRSGKRYRALIYVNGSDSSVVWNFFLVGARYPQTGARYPQRFRAEFAVESVPSWVETIVWASFWRSKMCQEQ